MVKVKEPFICVSTFFCQILDLFIVLSHIQLVCLVVLNYCQWVSDLGFLRCSLLSDSLNWQAKEMVEVSRSMANKIKEKQGAITEDEVRLQLRSPKFSACRKPVTNCRTRQRHKTLVKLWSDINLVLHDRVFILSPHIGLILMSSNVLCYRQYSLSPTFWAWVLLTPLPGKRMDQEHIIICNWLNNWEICCRHLWRWVRSFFHCVFNIYKSAEASLNHFYLLSLPLSSLHYFTSLFPPSPAVSGAWRYDGSYRGVLSRQPC